MKYSMTIIAFFLAFKAYGFIPAAEDIDLFLDLPSEEEKQEEIKTEDPIAVKIKYSYCLNGTGEVPPETKVVAFNSKFKCTYGYSPQYYYEAWLTQNPHLDLTSIDHTQLEPKLTADSGQLYTAIVMEKIKRDRKDLANCPLKSKTGPGKEQAVHYFECPDNKEVLFHEVAADIVKEYDLQKMAQDIFRFGEEGSKANNPEFLASLDKNTKPPVHKSVTPQTLTKIEVEPTKTTQENLNKNVPVTEAPPVIKSMQLDLTGGEPVKPEDLPKPEDKTALNSPTGNPGQEEQPHQAPVVEEDKDCSEALNQEITELLSDEKKNIIGLQYELTILKMASLVKANQSLTLEDLVRKKSKELSSINDGTLEKMNQVYKKYGLPEDAKAISENLKVKSKSANYLQRSKRFFNEESSAFLLAYQQLNKDAGIKENDISVMWFMRKVEEKSAQSHGAYSSLHNRTNLSTRLVQYTGALNQNKGLSKEKLDDMVKKQKAKIDSEFLALIENFKIKNSACYQKLFSSGEDECNLAVVETQFSHLMAISSKIPSTDLISLDNHLKGGLDKTRFSIDRYVETKSPVITRNPAQNPKKEETPAN